MRLVRSLSLLVCLVAVAPSVASAQSPQPPGPQYLATPPTNQVPERDGQTGRYLLGGEWLYRADPSDAGLTQGWFTNVASTSGWSPVTVPNAYNAGDFSTGSMTGSVGWYRRDFTLPAGAFGTWVPKAAQHWIVRFESVNYDATVWLNGHELGTHAVANLPFEFDLRYLRPGLNRLIIRVDDRRTAADFPPGRFGQWWNFGGLLGEVYLRAVARADLEQVMVRPILPCPTCAATIEEQALVRNVTGAPQTVQLSGRYGGLALQFGEQRIPPHGTWTATASAPVSHPQLWAPGQPTLYKATLTLSDVDGNRLGGYVTYSGIRSIKVTSTGQVELNGRVLHLLGVDLHEQNIVTGAALSPAQSAALVGWAKKLGATIIRAHYPLNPEIEELADRDGILIWSEVPVYQVQNTYLGQSGWLQHAHALLTDNILTNQNHPSILTWSIANELAATASPAQQRYIASAAALAHSLDPTRPVAMAIKDWTGIQCQAAAYAPLDIVGINEYYGWFDVGGGVTDDRDALEPFLQSVRQCMPNKALMITEFGFDANRTGPVEERGTYAFQSNSAAYALGVFGSDPWISGVMYFALQDYAAYPGYNGGNPLPNPPFNQKGLVDLYGNLKPSFGVVSSIYHSATQIAPLRRSSKKRQRTGRGL